MEFSLISSYVIMKDVMAFLSALSASGLRAISVTEIGTLFTATVFDVAETP